MLLVTGITGRSGTHFLHELAAHGYPGEIRCIVRSTSNLSALENCDLKIEKAVGDLGDQNFLNQAMQGANTILHIGSIFYSLAVAKAAAENNVKRMILVHTTGIYSRFKSASEEYRKIESSVNEIVEKCGGRLGLVYLRPTMIYGNLNDRNISVFIKMIDRFRLLPLIDHGKSLLQPVNGMDLGRAYYQLLSRPEILNGDYILSGDRPITMLRMFETINHELGKRTAFLSIPLPLGVLAASVLKALSLGRIDFVEKVQRMGENRNFPHDSAARDFGFAPMPFEQGLKIEIDEYIQSKSARSMSNL